MPVSLTIADAFNRPDSNSLGSTDIGEKAWTVVRGTAKISGNHVVFTDSPSTNPLATVETGTADVDARASVGVGDALYFRVSDANNWWRLRSSSTTETETYVYYTTSYSPGPWTFSGSYCENGSIYPPTGTYYGGDDHGYYTYYTQHMGLGSGGCGNAFKTAGDVGVGFLINSYNRTINAVSVRNTGTRSKTTYQLVLEKCEAGVVSKVWAQATTAAPVAIARVVTDRQVISVYSSTSSGAALTTITDTFNAVATAHGIGVGGGSTTFSSALDNFVLTGTVPDTPPAPPAERPGLNITVSDFVAVPANYSSIEVSWTSPGGGWTLMRLVRSRWGRPVHENDGVVLAEWTDAGSYFQDTHVSPGIWHYYGLFLYDGSTWSPAAHSSALMPREHGYVEQIPDLLPEHFLTDADGNRNDDVYRFLDVISWGANTVHTQEDILQSVSDAANVHDASLVVMSEQMGVGYQPLATSGLFRKRLLNSGPISGAKGTLHGLSDTVAHLVGYEVNFGSPTNLMLNDDQAMLASSRSLPAYNSSAVYNNGDMVTSGGKVYYWSLPSSEYLLGTAPTSGTANGWVEIPNASQTSDSPMGWVLKRLGGATALTAGAFGSTTISGVDAPDDVDSLRALMYTNVDNYSTVAVMTTDPEQGYDGMLRSAIPVPAVADDTDRIFNFSLWAKYGSTGEVAEGGTTYLAADFYDSFGSRINSISGRTTTWQAWDSFSQAAPMLSTGKELPGVGPTSGTPKVWTVQTGMPWMIVKRDDVYAAAPMDSANPGFISIDAASDASLLLTWLSDAPIGSTRKRGVVFRWVDDSNHFRVENTRVVRVVGGVETELVTFPAIKGGDRVRITWNGTSTGSILVEVNGTLVATASAGSNMSTAVTTGVAVV